MRNIVLASMTLDQAVIFEIGRRIDLLVKYGMKIPSWKIFSMIRCSAAIKAYRKHLYLLKIDAKVSNSKPFNPKRDMEIVDLLASPVTFDS